MITLGCYRETEPIVWQAKGHQQPSQAPQAEIFTSLALQIAQSCYYPSTFGPKVGITYLLGAPATSHAHITSKLVTVEVALFGPCTCHRGIFQLFPLAERTVLNIA